jgi:hypothetical protein
LYAYSPIQLYLFFVMFIKAPAVRNRHALLLLRCFKAKFISLTQTWPVTTHIYIFPVVLGEVTAVLGRVTAVLGRVTAVLGEVTAILGRVTAVLGEVTAVLGRVTAVLGGVTAVLGEVTAVLGESQPFWGD